MKIKTFVTIIVLTAFIGASLLPFQSDESYAAKTPSGNWKNYAAKSFSGGKGTQSNPYKISSAGELAFLAKQTNKGVKKYKNAFYRLTSDIDLSEHYWVPIGTEKKPFFGVFDGSGYTITCMEIKGKIKHAGLFGYLKYSIYLGPGTDLVRNIKCNNVKINVNGIAGGIAGYARNTTFYDCDVSGVIKANKSGGGIAGIMSINIFKDCSVDVKVQSKGYAGGIVGQWKEGGGYYSAENCIVKGSIKGRDYVGGIAGDIDTYSKQEDGYYPSWSEDSYKMSFNVKIDADISGRNYVGGFAGRMGWTANYDTDSWDWVDPNIFTKIDVRGKITGKKYVGGIFGKDTGHEFENCRFIGKVKGTAYTGGLVGFENNATAFKDAAAGGRIAKSYALGTVTGGKETGGLIGKLYSNKHSFLIDRSFFSGTVKSSSSGTGGLIGTAKIVTNDFNLKNSYVKGSVKGKTNTGGIIGALDMNTLRYVSLKNSYVSAALSGKSGTTGYIFGKDIPDYHTTLTNIYYNSTKTKKRPSGISSTTSNPALYGKPTAVKESNLVRKKLKGLDFKKTWMKRSSAKKSKTMYTPELRVFAKSKNKKIKADSKKSVRAPAYYKVTYSGGGGVMANGKKMAVKYVKYNALKKTAPPKFTRNGYIMNGIKAVSPKKLPKKLTNGKTKVKVKWKKDTSNPPAATSFSATRKSDTEAVVSWKTVAGVSGYRVYMSANKTTGFSKIATITSPGQTSYTKNGLAWAKPYYFKVTTYKKKPVPKESASGTAAEAKVLPPSAQTAIKTRNIDDGRVVISFSKVNCNGYEFQQASSASGAYKAIDTFPASYYQSGSVEYIVNEGNIGKPYFYRVLGYRYANGISGAKVYATSSNTVRGVSNPGKGRLDNAEVTGSAIKLYIFNYFCTGYDVYRAEDSGEFAKIHTILINGDVGVNRQENEGTDKGDYSGAAGDYYAVWTDTSVPAGHAYKYYITPFIDDYGERVDGLNSEVKSVSL